MPLDTGFRYDGMDSNVLMAGMMPFAAWLSALKGTKQRAKQQLGGRLPMM